MTEVELSSSPLQQNNLNRRDIPLPRASSRSSASVSHVESEETKSTIANCRMYENKFPEVEDLVMAEVKSIQEMGAYVALKEYNDIEGMILLSELSRRRIRSIAKIIRIGRQEVAVVLRVDKEKGYIDLSKRRVSEEELVKCEEKYNKSKAVHSIVRHVAESLSCDMESLYIKFGWPLYKKYGHAYDAFRLAVTDPDTVLQGLDLSMQMRDVLLSNIKRRLTPQPMKLRADIEVTCFKYEGIDAVKDALKKGEGCSTEEMPIKIKLVAPPLYVVVTSSIQKETGLKTLGMAIDAIRQQITKSGGDLIVKVAPRTVHERDERELSTLMEKLERENQDAHQDEDDDDSEEEEENVPGKTSN